MTKVALVIRDQQGIGFGISRALTKAKYHVAIASYPGSDSAAAQHVLKGLGDQAAYFQHDVVDIDHTTAFLDDIGVAMGSITTLISNASVGSPVRGMCWICTRRIMTFSWA